MEEISLARRRNVLKGKRTFFSVATLIVLCLVSIEAAAQSSRPVQIVGRAATIEPRVLVDFPTAGVLPKNSFASSVDFFQDGGLLTSISVAILKRVELGISYGGSNLLGSRKVTMNKLPGARLKWRLLDETVEFTAVAIGFDSQGKENYIDSTKRYTIKSPGFFVVFSKNYSFLGYLSIHGGFNYSLERKDGDDDPNGFLGIEKTLGPAMSFVAEYNLGTNDDHDRALGRGRGYLHIGWRWSIAEGFALAFDLKNLVKNQAQQSFSNRVLKLEYVRYF